jgi:transcriptional regulator with XRE-family HTH domain
VEKINAQLVNGRFGERMSMTRRARRVSQSELGKRIGLSRATIANLEAGNQNVQLHQVFSIAHALNAPVTEFLPPPSEVSVTYLPAPNPDQVFLQFARNQLLRKSGDDNENT